MPCVVRIWLFRKEFGQSMPEYVAALRVSEGVRRLRVDTLKVEANRARSRLPQQAPVLPRGPASDRPDAGQLRVQGTA